LADASLGDFIISGVKRAGVTGAVGHLVVMRKADASAQADVVDSHAIAGDAADTETLVVDLVPGALAANTVDGVISSSAATFAVLKNLVDSAADHAEPSGGLSEPFRAFTSLSSGVVGGVAGASGAGAVDSEIRRGAITDSGQDVVDFIGVASFSADLQGGIEEGIAGTSLAAGSNKMEPSPANASAISKEGILISTRSRLDGCVGGWHGWGGLGDALIAGEGVPIDADASLFFSVVDGVGGTCSALAVDVAVPADADALE
jgi:hypothetical protein